MPSLCELIFINESPLEGAIYVKDIRNREKRKKFTLVTRVKQQTIVSNRCKSSNVMLVSTKYDLDLLKVFI